MQDDLDGVESISELYSAEEPVSSFVESVCVRPGMYTLDGTLAEAGAFLEGFYSGMGGHSSTAAGREDAKRWGDFCHWACEKLTGRRDGWHLLFKALRNNYSTEEKAFIRLSQLCIEYRHHTGNPLR